MTSSGLVLTVVSGLVRFAPPADQTSQRPGDYRVLVRKNEIIADESPRLFRVRSANVDRLALSVVALQLVSEKRLAANGGKPTLRALLSDSKDRRAELAKRIAAAEKKPIQNVMQSRIVRPLGLKQTTVGSDGELQTNSEDLARLVIELNKSRAGESKFLSAVHAKLLLPDGGANSLGLSSYWNKSADLFDIELGPTASMRWMPAYQSAVLVQSNQLSTALDSAEGVVTGLNPGEGSPSFEPLHIAGDYAGARTCPVCEFMMLPMALFWVRDIDDPVVAPLIQQLEAAATTLGSDKFRPFIVFTGPSYSSPGADPAKAAAKIKSMASKLETKITCYTMIDSQAKKFLNDYRHPRLARNVLYLLKNRTIKQAIRDLDSSALTSLGLQGQIEKLVSAN